MYSNLIATVNLNDNIFHIMGLDSQINVCYASGKIVEDADVIRNVLIAHNAR